eukprot:TRINITY_DN91257_c0_g1_i1.p1 TRINITY_DN91257_c0_g1~~TRINITY_DN91257_c0_g1_i1.p1  ORF type:complete len:518 (+),score=109.57 TRINITY_DN91257_c0_g1_i1:89-1642(+)
MAMKQAQAPVANMQGFKRHIVSDFLADRYPYLEDIRGHLKNDDVSMAAGDRLFPRLVEQLMEPSMAPEQLCEALRTIWDLASHQENKCEAIVSDVVAAATNLLLHDSIPVRREAAKVITAMARVIPGRSLMPLGNTNMPRKLTGVHVPGPTLPRLAKLLLGCDDELVKMNVAEALCNITIFRDGCQQVVDHQTVKGIAQYLTAILPDVPTTRPLCMCLLYLLRTLAAVTMYASNGLRDVFGITLLGRVIAFLGQVPKGGIPVVSEEESTETVRNALRFLWHCGNDPVGRKEMLAADGVRFITAYLQHGDTKVREAAVCALNVISLETSGKKEVLQHSLSGLAALAHSRGETPYLHETCVQLCRCASELPAFRFAFARHTIESIWLLEKVYGTTALAAISPLLREGETAEMRTQAAKVMAYFLTKQEPAQGDLIRVPPVTPLDHINNPVMFAIEECVDCLHDLLSLLAVAPDPAFECLEALTTCDKPRIELRDILENNRATVDDPNHLERVRGLLLKA